MVGNLPIKKWRSGNIQGAVWSNKRELDRDGVKEEVEFKTFTLMRSWKDRNEDVWRNEKLNLKRQDIPKVLAILNRIQDELYLNTEKGDDNG
jgi:hypothetical protein